MEVKIDITETKPIAQPENVNVSNNDDNVENIKALFDAYNKSREHELDAFWKNSMFVWTFIAICLTVYGTVVLNFENENLSYFDNSPSFFLIFTSISGLTLSIIWHWMAKALKVRFKVNEVPVWKLENIDNIFGKNNVDKLSFNYNWSEKTPFSPSKLVMLIGWVLIAFWIILLLFGVYTHSSVSDFVSNNQGGFKFLLVACMCTPLVLIYIMRLIKFFNSSSIRKQEEQNVFLEVKKYLHLKSKFRYFEVKDSKIIFFYTKEEYESIKQDIENLFKDCKFEDNQEMEYSRYFKYDNNNISKYFKQ